jgi:hypothetical protein
MNILPIPALGRRAHRFPWLRGDFPAQDHRKVEGVINAVMLFMLLGLMVAVTFNDIWKHVK